MKNIVDYKNIHKGKRCFIVGNGPSVKIEDLDVLHENNEICFGFNTVFRVFDRTKWRPTYYCVADPHFISEMGKTIAALPIEDIFFLKWPKRFYPDNVHVVNFDKQVFYPNLPEFSEDISKVAYWGGCVVYDLGFQLSYFMGFSEVYVIGIDNTYINAAIDTRNHFIDNYFEDIDNFSFKVPWTERRAMENTLGYRKAEHFSRTHGFRIYNATRGGAVKEFERVNFDDLFSKK
ncbi:MAG: DUF115 domain-containing protein [bacterium]|nr:DUF115 domain-containing protein [bacterium]